MLLSSPFFSFYSFFCSGGIVLLLSSSIFPSCQVIVLFIPCSTGVLSNYVILVPLLYRYIGVVSYSFGSLSPCFMSFNPQGSCYVPCSSLIMECLQFSSSPWYSFLHFAQPLKVHGFTRLSKKQLSFTSLLLRP